MPTNRAVDLPREGPDFFIVGAPKSGTTALHEYLSQHPDVFMARKELHFFGSDLDWKGGKVTREQYREAFRGSSAAKRAGDASVRYLYSQRAALEIKSYRPSARIIVSLRDPVGVMQSAHNQAYFSGKETIADFEEALAAEPDRREGRRIPATCATPWSLIYRDIARYSEQLERYLDAFGESRVHVVIFDDFRRDPAKTYREVLAFLGIDQDHEPDFAVVNARKLPRLPVLSRLLYKPPIWLRIAAKVAVPSRRLRLRVLGAVIRLNTRPWEYPPMRQGLREQLEAEFAGEVERLEQLLGRDLSAWVPSVRGTSELEASTGARSG